MKKFLIILQLTLAIAFWLRLELSQLPFLLLIPYFLAGMFATLFVVARNTSLAFNQQVATGGIAGLLLSFGFNPSFPQFFVTGILSLGWLFGILLFAVYFFEGEASKPGPAFSRFASRFPADGSGILVPKQGESEGNALAQLRARFGGKSFGKGLYRVCTAAEANVIAYRLEDAFPEVKGRMTVFAYDWLNRIYGLDTARQRDGEALVMMANPLSGEVMEAPVGLLAFHDLSLADSGDELLDAAMFRKFLKLKGLKRLERDQAVSLVTSLAEGGQFEPANFALGALKLG
jgi:hypothetical protein